MYIIKITYLTKEGRNITTDLQINDEELKNVGNLVKQKAKYYKDIWKGSWESAEYKNRKNVCILKG